ncbi:MAG: immunoglobulin-like domain-containing protein, partial [Verrucomicrobiota bacterium]|nr:immunoglobulin-like domain-containing protein [Verrucomicrobiota bacterium]
ASASDIVDGALSPSTTGTVDTSVPGVDTITYSVSDAAGNESIAIRYVYVVSDDFVESIKANFGFIEQDSYDTLQDAYDQVVVERDARLTMEEVRDARVGSRIIAVENGQAVVRLQMEESSDLQVWEDTGDPATMTVPVPSDSDTKFIRFKMAE